MSAANASTALHLLAQAAVESRSTAEVQASRGVCAELLGTVVTDAEAQPRDLATASWALAKLAVDDPAPLRALVGSVCAKVADFEAQEVATVAWSFATLRSSESRGLCDVLAGIAACNAECYSPRHLVGVLWALGTVRACHQDFVWAAARITSGSQAKDWSPQDVANGMWAFAVLQAAAPAPLPAIGARAAGLGWKAFLPQELSISMWAAVRLGTSDARPAAHDAVRRLLQHSARQLRAAGARGYEPRHCANAAWALAWWQRHCRLTGLPQECKPAVCRPALRALADEAAQQLDKFSARELSRLLWALGSQSCLRLRLFSPRLALDFRRQGRLSEFDHDELLSMTTVLAWMLERAVWERPDAPIKALGNYKTTLREMRSLECGHDRPCQPQAMLCRRPRPAACSGRQRRWASASAHAFRGCRRPRPPDAASLAQAARSPLLTPAATHLR